MPSGLIAHGGRVVFVGITTDECAFVIRCSHKPEGTLLCSRNALPEDLRIIGLIETAGWTPRCGSRTGLRLKTSSTSSHRTRARDGSDKSDDRYR
jgi:hypothetical protein